MFEFALSLATCRYVSCVLSRASVVFADFWKKLMGLASVSSCLLRSI
jgi:hypothetical protein